MSRLVVLLTLSIAPTELFAALVSGIQVVRAQPGDYLLARGLSQLALEAFYGRFELSHGPLSYLQRGIIESDVLLDLTARLRYYEEARGRMLRHQGAVYVAKDEAGRACGFADVGLAVYDPQKQTFRLPKRPEGDVEQPEGSELRPYLSNLAVSEACRRAGVGRLLVDACEAEAKCWEDGAYERVRARRNGALARLNVTTKDGPKPLGADHVVVLYPQALFVGAGRREIVCYSPDVSADVNAVLRRYGLGKCVVPPPDPLDRHANGDRNHEVHETAFSRREVCGLYPEDCRLFDEYCRH